MTTAVGTTVIDHQFFGHPIFRQTPIMEPDSTPFLFKLFRPWRASYVSWVQDTSWSRFVHFGRLHHRWLCWCTCEKHVEIPDDFNGFFLFPADKWVATLNTQTGSGLALDLFHLKHGELHIGGIGWLELSPRHLIKMKQTADSLVVQCEICTSQPIQPRGYPHEFCFWANASKPGPSNSFCEAFSSFLVVCKHQKIRLESPYISMHD